MPLLSGLQDRWLVISSQRTLMTLYVLSSFTQALPMVAIGILLREDLGLASDNVALALFYANAFIPLYFRFLYGFVSDNFPVCGTRRLFYLLVCYAAMSLLYLLYGTWVVSLPRAYVVAILLNVVFAFSESCLDAIAVQRSRTAANNSTGIADPTAEDHGYTKAASDIQSAAMLCRTLGTLLIGFVASALGALLPHRTVIASTCVVPLCSALTVVSCRSDIETHHRPTLSRTSCCDFPVTEIVAIVRPLLRPCCFIVIFAMMPNTTDVYTSYIYTVFSYNQTILNFLGISYTVGSLLGTSLYWWLLRDSPLTKVFICSTIIAACAGLTRLCVIWHVNRVLAIPDGVFVAVDILFVATCNSVALMPVLVLAGVTASRTQDSEGFIFAALMAFNSLGGYLSAYWSVLVLKVTGNPGQDNDYRGLWLAIVICTLASLIPLFVLPLLKARSTLNERLLDDPSQR
ncbi:hypothetical protein FOZ63_008473 [Perkinsus olseni]|uniref:Uncharacterized protein n=2 Tax=Perkinsus olseni TaxID=32597 RepID=A0A7J6UB60_PEROL|nr:hypothetical protein FOZ63_008473 [Perkinsus olseni]